MAVAVQEGCCAVANHVLDLAGTKNTLAGLEGPELVVAAGRRERPGGPVELVAPHQYPVRLRARGRCQQQNCGSQQEEVSPCGRHGFPDLGAAKRAQMFRFRTSAFPGYWWFHHHGWLPFRFAIAFCRFEDCPQTLQLSEKSENGPQQGYWISIPLTRELSLTLVNWITYWPLELAFTVNCWMIALFLAPAAAKISKLVSTCVPLMVTLKMREPAADQKVSAKCRRTVWLDPAAAPGMV